MGAVANNLLKKDLSGNYKTAKEALQFAEIMHGARDIYNNNFILYENPKTKPFRLIPISGESEKHGDGQLTWFKEPYLEADDIQPGIKFERWSRWYYSVSNPYNSPIYESLANISVLTQDGKYGMISYDGEIKLAAEYDRMYYEPDYAAWHVDGHRRVTENYTLETSSETGRGGAGSFVWEENSGALYVVITHPGSQYLYGPLLTAQMVPVQRFSADISALEVVDVEETMMDAWFSNKLWGFDCTQAKAYKIYKAGQDTESRLYDRDAKWGYATGKKQILSCDYDLVTLPSNDMGMAKIGETWDYVEMDGRM